MDGEAGTGAGLATQAKQALLEKQKLEEESAKNKARPEIVSIVVIFVETIIFSIV